MCAQAYSWSSFPDSGVANFESTARAALELWRTNASSMDVEVYAGRGGETSIHVRFNNIETEITNARDSEANLLAKQDAQDALITTAQNEITAGRDSEASLIDKQNAQDTLISAAQAEVTAGRDGEASLIDKQDAQDTLIAGKANITHSHGAGGIIMTLISGSGNLGTGSTDGEIKFVVDEYENMYSWDNDNSKWRIHTGNKYATVDLPGSATYTIHTGTDVYDLTTDEQKRWSGSAWDDTGYDPPAGMVEKNWVEKNSNYTASVNDVIMMTTISGVFTITMPTGTFDDTISFVDGGANCDINNVTISSSQNIMGSSDNLTVDTKNITFGLTYYNLSRGWVIS